MKITQFNKENLRGLRKVLEDAFDIIRKEHGIIINIGTISFTDNDFSCRLKGSPINSVTNINFDNTNFVNNNIYDSLSQTAFSQGYDDDILNDSDLGKEFRFRNETYTIIGGKIRSYKYPILAKNKKNKIYKFKFFDVVNGLGRKIERRFNE